MCYFSNALRSPHVTVNAICHSLNDPKFDRVDFIVGTGISGTVVLLPVSMKSGIPCGVVRKRVDREAGICEGGSHSSAKIEASIPENHRIYRYVIIDDLMDSGNTINTIREAVDETYKHSRCVGIILYQNYSCDADRKNWRGIPTTSLSRDIELIDVFKKTGEWVLS